jgi:hypothetical protein
MAMYLPRHQIETIRDANEVKSGELLFPIAGNARALGVGQSHSPYIVALEGEHAWAPVLLGMWDPMPMQRVKTDIQFEVDLTSAIDTRSDPSQLGDLSVWPNGLVTLHVTAQRSTRFVPILVLGEIDQEAPPNWVNYRGWRIVADQGGREPQVLFEKKFGGRTRET